MLSDHELIEGFEAATLAADAFHHSEHVRVAWLFVKREGMPLAIGRFSDTLRRFAAAKGKPDLYHETITWAYLLLIGERLARQPAATWQAFATANADLLAWKPSILDRYYSTDLLWSDLARRTFVMPDRVRGQGSGVRGQVGIREQRSGREQEAGISRVRDQDAP